MVMALLVDNLSYTDPPHSSPMPSFTHNRYCCCPLSVAMPNNSSPRQLSAPHSREGEREAVRLVGRGNTLTETPVNRWDGNGLHTMHLPLTKHHKGEEEVERIQRSYYIRLCT